MSKESNSNASRRERFDRNFSKWGAGLLVAAILFPPIYGLPLIPANYRQNALAKEGEQNIEGFKDVSFWSVYNIPGGRGTVQKDGTFFTRAEIELDNGSTCKVRYAQGDTIGFSDVHIVDYGKCPLIDHE